VADKRSAKARPHVSLLERSIDTLRPPSGLVCEGGRDGWVHPLGATLSSLRARAAPMDCQNDRVEGGQAIASDRFDSQVSLPMTPQQPGPTQCCGSVGSRDVPRLHVTPVEHTPIVWQRHDWQGLVCDHDVSFSTCVCGGDAGCLVFERERSGDVKRLRELPE